MFDSLITLLVGVVGAAGIVFTAWVGRRAYTRVKTERDRIAENQKALDAAVQRAIEARRKANVKVALDPKRRDEFEKQP